ncbi:hypothetical protein AA313_de0210162 [Arthrobotrys entomopaga]|nr:hypothetical protein AA313_de0210162 [Arthrobotrys entomopaga]
MGCRQFSQTQTAISSLRSVLWLILLRMALATDCFFPNGTQSEDSPCNPNGPSMCCGPGVSCLGNGVCLGGTYLSGIWRYTFARGSCTDQNWEDHHCFNPDGDSSGNDCATRDDVFSLSGGTSIVTVIGIPGPTTVTTTTTVTSTIVSTKTEVSTVTNAITRVSTIVVTSFLQPDGQPASSVNIQASPTSPRAAASGSKTTTGTSSEQTGTLAPSSPSTTTTTTNTITMGAAVGSSLGAVIVCMSAYIAYLRRKREEAERMIPTQPIWQTGQPNLPGTMGPPPGHAPVPPLMMPNYAIPLAPVPPPPPPLSPPNYHWSPSSG